MAKFLMMGKYTTEALQDVSAQRTEKAVAMIKEAGGNVDSMYALLGNYDLALIVDFPGVNEAITTSIALTKMTNIAFTTLPALPVAEFDKIVK